MVIAAGRRATMTMVFATFAAGVTAAAPRSLRADSYRGKNLHNADLSGRKLQAQDFTEADLSGADLSSADCSQSLFKGAKLIGANLAATSFRDADLSEASLSGVSIGPGLRNAKFHNANLHRATIKLVGAVMPTDAEAAADPDVERLRRNIAQSLRDYGVQQDRDSGNLTFRGADLSGALVLGNLAGVDFREADLRGAIFTASVNADDANFRGALYDNETIWKSRQVGKGAILSPSPTPPQGQTQDRK